jgi:hypothetical protein
VGTTTEDVLRQINEQTRTRWEPLGPMSGGFQSGTTGIIGPDGFRAVLKWSPRREWAHRVLSAAPVVRYARGRGYPTPRWLAVGTTTEGYPWLVYEYLRGSPAAQLGTEEAEFLISLVRQSIDMEPPTEMDWSAYIVPYVFEDSRGHQAQLQRLGGAVGRAVEAVVEISRPFHDVRIPDRDLVHGDLSLGNLICRSGKPIGVVDIEAVGRGSAMYDLMCVLRTAYLDGAAEGVIPMLESAATDLASPGVIALCLATQVIEILQFGLTHWAESLQVPAQRLVSWVADCRRLIGLAG